MPFRSAVAAALVLAGGTAMASPCPMMTLQSKALQKESRVSDEGGILVGEVATQQEYSSAAPNKDRSKWQVRVAGKAAAAKQDTIAPGLVVYRPPAKATAYELVDAKGTKLSSAKVVAKLPDLLDAPRVTRVTSGVTNSRHPSSFTNVELDAAPPKTAVALVLQKAKGPALSWGTPFDTEKTVNVFTTGGGCVGEFSDGFTQAPVGELVTAFWVDANGRRSRVSQQIVVQRGNGE